MRPALTTLLLLAACGSGPSQPVPLVGTAADLRALAGQWTGSYQADNGGRNGSIVFHLQAGSDTAFGDVIMVPIAWAGGGQNDGRATGRVPEVAPPRALTIRFVRVTGDRIAGQLDPYRDPECGCHLRTVFEGELKGNVLRGTYTSYHEEGGHKVTGRWRVEREKAP